MIKRISKKYAMTEKGAKDYVACGYTDMRRGIDGLADRKSTRLNSSH